MKRKEVEDQLCHNKTGGFLGKKISHSDIDPVIRITPMAGLLQF